MNLIFTGDIMLGRDIMKCLDKKDFNLLNNKLHKKINSSICISNLECALTKKGDDSNHELFIGKGNSLEKTKFVNIFSLANNHIYDSGKKGLISTIKFLSKFNIENNGIFSSNYTPKKLKALDQKVEIYCCTDFSNLKPNNDENYRINFTDTDKISNYLTESKADFKILYIHGGMMFTRIPNLSARRRCREFINLGFDAVIMNHSHVAGVHELYNGKLICYGLGDFIMDGKSFRRRVSKIIKITRDSKNILSYKFFFTRINSKFVVRELNGPRKIYLIFKLKCYSLLLKLSDKNYSKAYRLIYPLQIISHSISTVLYQLLKKGPFFLISLYKHRRKDFKNMFKWMLKNTNESKHNLEEEL